MVVELQKWYREQLGAKSRMFSLNYSFAGYHLRANSISIFPAIIPLSLQWVEVAPGFSWPALSFYHEGSQRLFSHEQRLAIFRRDNCLCQLRLKCDGVKCEWDAWEADHKVAWSQGGKTTVENGQVACPACNSSKGAAP